MSSKRVEIFLLILHSMCNRKKEKKINNRIILMPNDQRRKNKVTPKTTITGAGATKSAAAMARCLGKKICR